MKPPESTGGVRAVGLDLGSTAIKAAGLDAKGRLVGVASVAAPPLRGEGNRREASAEAYADAARRLLESVALDVPRGTPLGIASQRSTFTLWSPRDGRSRIPMISWQDTRAAGWCDEHRGIEPDVVRRTGLPLSAHYAGPKLATIQRDPDLARALRGGDLLFGTLDAYLLWQWTGGRRHESDVTVAARTLMLDLDLEDWSPELLRYFDVPRSALPSVVRSTGRSIALDPGPRLTASVADQAAAALAVLDDDPNHALVNFGTGAFVLCPARKSAARKRGYLFAPVLATERADSRYVLEGTVNGAGPAVDRFGPGPTALPDEDPAPEAFAVPDLAGLGSPHWQPDLGLTLSSAAQRLSRPDRRRVVLEGLLFRVREILEDLCETGLPERVTVAGGLIRDPALGPGLASLLNRRVELLTERESGLLGACRLAAGLTPWAGSPTTERRPGSTGAYLSDKFRRWKDWFESVRAGV